MTADLSCILFKAQQDPFGIAGSVWEYTGQYISMGMLLSFEYKFNNNVENNGSSSLVQLRMDVPSPQNGNKTKRNLDWRERPSENILNLL